MHARLLYWMGSSKDELREFPDDVRRECGYSLQRVQLGENPTNVKVLSNFKSSKVREIKENDSDGTYRVVFTVEYADAVYVLHAFQKKSKTGKKTDPKDVARIEAALKEVKRIREESGKGSN